ncbi:hypothetical protein Bbelb_035030 [Branchiostoma belcheri]|nr:hypothetical protein Bbelb_439490 [Branchiostoma belcheri]KAI8520246.1 hypothetical protein Bbelb_035030 [Branchiostoma belcheri]
MKYGNKIKYADSAWRCDLQKPYRGGLKGIPPRGSEAEIGALHLRLLFSCCRRVRTIQTACVACHLPMMTLDWCRDYRLELNEPISCGIEAICGCPTADLCHLRFHCQYRHRQYP